MDGDDNEHDGGSEREEEEEEVFINEDDMIAVGDEEIGKGDCDHSIDDDDFQAEEAATAIISFAEHADSVYATAINPVCGDIVATGSGDDTACMWRWDASGVYVLNRISSHSDSVNCLSFSRDGQYLACGALDGTISVHKVVEGDAPQKELLLDGPSDGIEWLDWHPRGPVLLCGSSDGTVWMWKIPQGALMVVFGGGQAHVGPCTCGSFTYDGHSVVTTGADSFLGVWDPKNGSCVSRIRVSSSSDSPVLSMGLCSWNDRLVLTGCEDGSAALSNIESSKPLGYLLGQHSDSIESVGFCNSGLSIAATAGMDGKMVIWDANTMTPRNTIQHTSGIVKLRWHQTEPWVYTACVDGTVSLWDGRAQDCIHRWRGHEQPLLSMSISTDGRTILTGGDDSRALLYTW